MTDPVSSKRLWQSVVTKAIRDLCNSNPHNREDVESWVGSYPNADFREVCFLAGLEARRVHTTLSYMCQLAPADRKKLLDKFTPVLRNRKAA